MEVILLKDVTDVGKRGEVVEVKAGYAHKHLLLNGAAMVVTRMPKTTSARMPKSKPDFLLHLPVPLELDDANELLRALIKESAALRRKIDFFGLPPVPEIVGSEPDSGPAIEDPGRRLVHLWLPVLDLLRSARDEARTAYADVTHREIAWRFLQDLVSGPFWAAVELLQDDPYRQQLADVLDAAVGKLEAFQLDKKHFSAIDSTLSRLSAKTISEDDVDACERAWEAADIATVPALRSAFEEWLTSSYSGVEDGG